jgi:hypothetical protein
VKEMIEERRNALDQGDNQRADLLTSLIKGAAVHDEKAGQSGISDNEISGKPQRMGSDTGILLTSWIGNTFVFLFAGKFYTPLVEAFIANSFQ